MNLFQQLRNVLLLLAIVVGLVACGQKGPLMLPPKNTAPKPVNPVVFPEESETTGQSATDGKVLEGQSQNQEEPLGILPSTTRHPHKKAK
ncbi:MAG: lipoprotein [Oxalobacter sp.]|nr:lipoprotein [Oxalobacter sp.]